MALTMVPAADLLPDVLPTERLTANGMPVPEVRAELRRIPNARNAVTVAMFWVTTVGIVVGAVWIGHPLGWVAAFLLMGPQHARIASLGHEAAHRLLFTNKRVNDWVGRWVVGYPGFFPVDIYRRGHMAHHKDEFGPNEPDLALYTGYPITRSSFWRKMRRDLLFSTGWKNLKPLLQSLRNGGKPNHGRRIVAVQLVLLAICTVLGYPLVWLLLWFVPFMTTWRVINRLRSIAEHGGMERSADRRRTTHVVDQHRVAGFVMVPYNIGYHLAHHVDMGVPFRSLPKLDRELRAAGWVPDGLVHPSYRELWRCLRRRPEPAAAEPVGAAATA